MADYLKDSRMLGSYQITDIPILDIHELASCKLVALFSRYQARDLFDSHSLLKQGNLDKNRLRAGFVVYGAMNRKDWRTVKAEDIKLHAKEVSQQLIPM